MKVFLNLFAGLSIYLLMPLSFAHADDANNARVAQFMKAIVAQDIIFDLSSLKSTNNAFFSLPDEPKLNYSVSAVEITRDFMNNRSQADKKYGHAVFDVIGQISAIKNDDGKVSIAFKTSKDAAQNTIASLTSKASQKVENYKVGQMLKLRCNGAQYSTILTLTSCKEMPPIIQEATKVADEAVDMFLNGENIEKVLATNGNKPASHTLFFLWYIGTHFQLNDDCYSRQTIRNCNFTKYNIQQLSQTDEYKKAYEKGKEFYHLP